MVQARGTPQRDDSAWPWLLMSLALIMLWDAGGLDIAVTRWFGGPEGFAWRNHWLIGRVLHDSAKYLAWPVLILLAIGIWRPASFMRPLTCAQRVWWVLTTLACVLFISWLRKHSATSCPWELKEFGGTMHRYIPHWMFFRSDGGPGQCFPSGHASTAFAFFSGWLALRRTSPRAAKAWLFSTLALGALFGGVQVMRGAHFVSHSLWTAWICAAVSLFAYRISPCWNLLAMPEGAIEEITEGQETTACTVRYRTAKQGFFICQTPTRPLE